MERKHFLQQSDEYAPKAYFQAQQAGQDAEYLKSNIQIEDQPGTAQQERERELATSSLQVRFDCRSSDNVDTNSSLGLKPGRLYIGFSTAIMTISFDAEEICRS